MGISPSRPPSTLTVQELITRLQEFEDDKSNECHDARGTFLRSEAEQIRMAFKAGTYVHNTGRVDDGV
jgi:hypothetical protein